jgi:hypothetical protein
LKRRKTKSKGQVHGAQKERRRTRTRRRIIIIIIRNGAKTISLQTLFGRLNKISQFIMNKLRDFSATDTTEPFLSIIY